MKLFTINVASRLPTTMGYGRALFGDGMIIYMHDSGMTVLTYIRMEPALFLYSVSIYLSSYECVDHVMRRAELTRDELR